MVSFLTGVVSVQLGQHKHLSKSQLRLRSAKGQSQRSPVQHDQWTCPDLVTELTLGARQECLGQHLLDQLIQVSIRDDPEFLDSSQTNKNQPLNGWSNTNDTVSSPTVELETPKSQKI